MLFKVVTELEFKDATSFAAFAADFEKFVAKYNSVLATDAWPKHSPDSLVTSPAPKFAAAPPATDNVTTVAKPVYEKVSPPSSLTASSESPAASAPETVQPVAVSGTESSDESKSPLPPTPQVADSSEATKRKRATKAEMEARRAAAAAPAEETKPASMATYTQDDLKAAFAKMTQALGAKAGEKTAEILMHFKIERLRDLPEARFGECVDWLRRLVSQPDATAKRIGDEIPH